jgi:hypothetical protein
MKASLVACGHDLLQHDIKEDVEVVGKSTIEPMSPVVRHDDNDKNLGPRSAHVRELGWSYLGERVVGWRGLKICDIWGGGGEEGGRCWGSARWRGELHQSRQDARNDRERSVSVVGAPLVYTLNFSFLGSLFIKCVTHNGELNIVHGEGDKAEEMSFLAKYCTILHITSSM